VETTVTTPIKTKFKQKATQRHQKAYCVFSITADNKAGTPY
jgi:hypothetical protein